MKNICKNVFVVYFLILNFSNTVKCGTLLGRANTNYTTTHNIFRSGQSAIGVVRMNNGFTVATPASGVGSTHGSIAFMDTCISVSGAIDLRTTNTIFLLEDLTLDNSVTFSPSGGSIYGYDRALILNGNLNIPNDSTLHIGGRIIIDGNGNTITFGNNSKFLVDANATLTLKNLVLKSTQNQPGNPCLQCSTFGSNICLQDVVLNLADNFYFNRGQLFIHNDVSITGTSALVYCSPKPVIIDSASTLYFDTGTTFSIAPVTFTDCPYSSIPTTTTNNFVFMKNKTSQIYLNGCDLCITLTGCRFRTGTMILDNKVSFHSNYTLTIAEIPATQAGSTVVLSNNPRYVSWSPDGKTLALVEQTSNNLKLYSFDGVNTPSLLVTQATTSGASGVSWTPDGKFLAVASTGGTVQVFKFTKPNSISALGSATLATAHNVTWSPDGRFIAASNWAASGLLNVWRFNSVNLIQMASVATGSIISGISWSPDGKFIVVPNYTINTLQVYKFYESGSLSKIGSDAPITLPVGSKWSPDGRFIAVGGDTVATDSIKIFSFDGVSTPRLVSTVSMASKSIFGLSWAPNGKFLAVGAFNLACIQIYAFNGSDTLTLMGTIPTSKVNIPSIDWSPDGNFIAGVSYQSPGDLQIFRVNYIVDRTTQACSNSIVFGNSALGQNYDLNVKVLADANVNVDGILNYDNVS
ncbi:MAG: hypothetical protein WC192_00460 [Candidatus Babeliales bacterium]